MPARLADVRRVLRKMGCDVEPPGRGSHWAARSHVNGRSFPLVAHNGLKSEISDRYIRLMCAMLGLDHDEFLRRLRGE